MNMVLFCAKTLRNGALCQTRSRVDEVVWVDGRHYCRRHGNALLQDRAAPAPAAEAA